MTRLRGQLFLSDWNPKPTGTLCMSISFRNDFGQTDVRLVNDVRPANDVRLVKDVRNVNGTHDLRVGDAGLLATSPPLTSPPLDARLTEIKNGATARDLPDVKMDQIRELLFGEVQRQSDQRIASMEARVRELETTLHHPLDAMQARIDALAGDARDDRRSTLEELARGIAELGDRVKRIPG